MYKIKIVLLLLFLGLGFTSCMGNDGVKNSIQDQSIFVASWNLENLFDTVDDPEKNDEWFTPESEINYTEEKLDRKLDSLAKVISLMNNGNGPDILGVQEIENREVIEKLIGKVITQKSYSIVHFESPDKRGIDNAIIYNSKLFKINSSEGLEVYFDDEVKTRLIVYAELEYGLEQLHVFVNHWPSRREGLKESEPKRIKAAETLINKLNTIENYRTENIIILGDFNDMPANISISKTLGAIDFNCDSVSSSGFQLYNLSYKLFQQGKGTYKYRDHWNMLDQIIVSNSLLDGKKLDYNCDSFSIFKPDFIVEKEGKYAGSPFPTYGGRKYLGGFSDHFPVTAVFRVGK